MQALWWYQREARSRVAKASLSQSLASSFAATHAQWAEAVAPRIRRPSCATGHLIRGVVRVDVTTVVTD